MERWLAAGLICWAIASPSGLARDGAGEPAERLMALTIDDLPGTGGGASNLDDMRAIADRMLPVLVKQDAPAVGFVVESRLLVEGEVDDRIALLRRWMEAGVSLGNHTFSHSRLQETPLEDYMDDVVRGDVISRMLMKEAGRPVLYFRYPYNSTGATREVKELFEAFLRERGYRIAPFTIEAADYMFDAIYVDALRRRDEALATRTLRAYLDHTDTMCEFFEKRSRELLGREVPQILLIHANAINAAATGELLGRIRGRGYRFVTLERALEDEAYSIPDDYVGPRGISWIHRWTVNLGREMHYEREPDPPAEILERYRAILESR